MSDIQAFRQHKDDFFRSSSQAPLERQAQKTFAGLNYYPPSEAYVIRAPLERSLDPETLNPETVTLQTSAGDTKDYLRYGVARFTLDDTASSLTLFALEGADRLFIPFKDATSGHETYGAGRYLEARAEGDTVLLDFNYAYNPYCAYSGRYRCPLPPLENHLRVAIRAGEKTYP